MKNRNRRQTLYQSRYKKSGQGLVAKTAAGVVAGATLLVGASFVVPQVVEAAPDTAMVFIYTAPDAQTTAYALSHDEKDALSQAATDHDAVELVRVEGDCTVSTATIDMTPRVTEPDGEPLEVPARIKEAVKDKIAAIEAAMNTATPGTTSRCLYGGLLQTRPPEGVPVFVHSSSIDLEKPVDVRTLFWSTSPDEIVKTVNAYGAVPDLKGADITFVMTAPSTYGGQQIRAAQLEYQRALWRTLLTNGGAGSVDFVDGKPGDASSTEDVPIVPLPELPGTPVPVVPDPEEPEVFSCTLDGATAFFQVDEATFVDEDIVKASLADCVSRIAPDSSVTVESWISYEGPLDASNKPSGAGDVALSERRSAATRDLMVSMGVDPSMFKSVVGHGAVDQPYTDDPRSPKNRVSIITVTPPGKDN